MVAKTKKETVSVKNVRVMQSSKNAAKIDKFFEKKEVVVEPVVFIDENLNKNVAKDLNVQPLVKEESEARRAISGKTVLVAFLVFVFVCALGLAGYFYYQYRKATAADAGKNEIAEYVAKINKFMVLPNGEEPTMATVADKDKLSGQAFFSKAENGDKVLFFSKSQKAILYRPSSNMIIEATAMAGGVSPVAAPQAEPAQQSPAPTEQAQKPAEETKQPEAVVEIKQEARVFVENGTSEKGLAKIMAEKISQIAGVTIADTGNAVGNFDKTIVVNVSGKSTLIADEIVKSIGGSLGTLPEGEKIPDADILVIVGQK